MSELVRFGVSIGTDLLGRFDKLIESKNYANRSEAIRDLIRQNLVAEKWKSSDKETVGVISLVYDHHQRELTEALTAMQHDFGEGAVSSLHVHLDHHHCLEVIVVRGEASAVKKLADRLIGVRGVLHGGLFPTSTGNEL
jgi:CopG family transcriptional regulator, nickel-responsive regulator